jgi:hypothetical protein
MGDELMLAWIGYAAASFIISVMLAQLFPDGRFPLSTLFLVILVSTGGAWAGNRYLGDVSIFTGAFVGAALTSGLLFLLFHRMGLLVQDPPDKQNTES